MSHRDERKQMHLHRIVVPCPAHGEHMYVMAGLDHAVDDAAEHLVRTLRGNGYAPDHVQTQLDLGAFKARLFTDGRDDDDIPF